VFYALGAVLLNILFNECKFSLVSADCVRQIVFRDGFFGVADKTADRFDAGARLQILVFSLVLEHMGKRFNATDAKDLKDSQQNLLHSF